MTTGKWIKLKAMRRRIHEGVLPDVLEAGTTLRLDLARPNPLVEFALLPILDVRPRLHGSTDIPYTFRAR